ncbi:MAG: hypothetical protein K2L70_00735 [Clostridia bacterium]|nr:hypothetical protein [Clostridia bacterium]
MYYWRIWQWKNGEKNEKGEYKNNTEYTDYVVAPIFIEDRLDETMDTGEIILKGMPISTKNDFPPKIKFRLERYLKEDHSDTPKKWDFVVEHDDVEEYVGCPEICTHRIHLIEASVIAQGMHVDNIALTYELQDVDLNYKVVKPNGGSVDDLLDTNSGLNINSAKKNKIIKEETRYPGNPLVIIDRNGEFINAYKYVWEANSLNGMKKIVLNHHAVNSSIITFDIPKLYIYGSKDNVDWNDEPLFQLNTITRVKKILKCNGEIVEPEPGKKFEEKEFADGSKSIYSGATNILDRDDSYCYCKDGEAKLRKIEDFEAYAEYDDFKFIYTTFPVIAKSNKNYAQQATFYTDVLSVEQLEAGYTVDYEISCVADSKYQDGMVSYYKQQYYSHYSASIGLPTKLGHCRTEKLSNEIANDIIVKAEIHCTNRADSANAPFVRKGVKYSCYDLLRKALLTCDTYLLDNTKECLDELGVTAESNGNLIEVKSMEFPIIISDDPKEDWKSRLKIAKVYETVFEQKNLWEVLIQIGYYLHAIPYLEFAEDGSDRFVLKFQQLGNTKKKDDTNNKITIFNSRNLSEYFTQYDSYMTNLFSPQNEIEEWIVPKTSDSTYLVSNDTAELQTKYSITEIIEFDIIYEGVSKPALSCLFEKSIYEILTNADPSQIVPAKGNSIYYTLGDNKIQGLSYVAPNVSVGDNLMSLKYIMQKLFGVNPSVWTQDYTFNNLCFHIKYRTQDSARITQFRPDLHKFVKNSSYEKYPHHEQFYGQQDKIVDSERFSANLWGKLIRVGNAVYQRQEQVINAADAKESGDLVMIDDEPYYVTTVENECYADVILQKVTYTKNFNQLSQIVTIPSEPRFYEVSERAKVRREVRIQEFFVLSTEDTDNTKEKNKPLFMASDKWSEFIKQLIFCKDHKLPNFAYTKFMADRLRKHVRYLMADELFPSNGFNRTGENTIEPLESKSYADCIVPLLHFPLHDGIIFEWDMDDNFKAGDYIDKDVSGDGNSNDSAYMSQQSLRYVDILGRADLFRFELFHNDKWNEKQAQQLPMANNITLPSDSVIGVQGHDNIAIALDKDNREEISFNYQINLLHSAKEGDDDFITFPNLFGRKTDDLKVCLSTQEQSLFNENVNLTSAAIIASVPYEFGKSDKGSLTIEFGKPKFIDGADISQVKSIIFYHEDDETGRVAYIAKNVAKLTDNKKLLRWYIFPIFNS